MTQEQIHASLDEMLANPKSRNFLNHLVRAYMPVTNVDKVWNKPEGVFKCVITKDPLISIQEVMEGMHTEQFKTDMMNHMKSMFDEKSDTQSAMAKLIGEKRLGVTGKETNTFMSFPVYQEFYNWIITKSLKGDKHINWLIGSIRRSTFIERAENIQDSEVQKKVQNIKKASGATTYTLGDASGVLSQLKAQLESKDKK